MAGKTQIAAVAFIARFLVDRGRCCSTSELNDGMDLRNRGKAVGIMRGLERTGYIKRKEKSYTSATLTERGQALATSPSVKIHQGEFEPKPMKAKLFHKLIAPHDAVGTVWEGLVKEPRHSVLQSGRNSVKIGPLVTKTRWRGMPLYYLTLEERATCPRSCAHWGDCYGNNMHLAVRYKHGPDLERVLDRELRQLAEEHKQGFVVRLHMLGDFYSPEYAQQWRLWLDQIPQLNVFGYTAHGRDTDIGFAVYATVVCHPTRFMVRRSGATTGRLLAQTINRMPNKVRQPEGLVCPHQLGHVRNCGECGLCWTSKEPILFVDHAFTRRGS